MSAGERTQGSEFLHRSVFGTGAVRKHDSACVFAAGRFPARRG
ncbi:hypothetical protein LG3211_1455 [Lysobacter gummosus]|nr:hypothetical protein LG3211_1455 [Lysobacter gummosus]